MAALPDQLARLTCCRALQIRSRIRGSNPLARGRQ